jgi:hypothetical protein
MAVTHLETETAASQCDKKPGACTQCLKGGRVCPGYRSLIDVLFRDQTSKVIGNAHNAHVSRRRRTHHTQDLLRTRCNRTHCQGQSRLTSPVENLTIIKQLSIDLVDVSMCHFVQDLLSSAQLPIMGCLGTFKRLYRGTRGGDCLFHCARAVSLASFTRPSNNSSVTAASQVEYSKALRAVKIALDADNVQTSICLVLSILFLGYYEIFSATAGTSLLAETHHFKGCALLLRPQLSSKGQTSTDERLMLAEVLHTVLFSYLNQADPLPEPVLQLTRALSKYEDGIGRALGTMVLMMEANQLIARATSITTRSDLAAAIVKLQSLDCAIDSQCRTLSSGPAGAVNRVDTEVHSVAVFRRRVDIYNLASVGRMWNSFRVVRLRIQAQVSTSLQHFQLQGLSTTPRLPQPSGTIQRLCEDILATVPQQFGHESAMHTFPVRGKVRLATTECAGASTRALLALIWPLYTVAALQSSCIETSTYCSLILKEIGDRTGARQAYVLGRQISGPPMF